MQKSPGRAETLQKYLLLHSQHDALQRHLEKIVPSTPSAPSSNFSSMSPNRSRYDSMSSSSSSPENSPPRASTRHHHRGGSVPHTSFLPHPRPPPATSSRRRRSSLPSVVDERLLGAIEEDESKLTDVNMQIKTTLTELLNCENVRSDRRYRMWVQTRLMDAEMELKQSRSRSCEKKRNEGEVLGMVG